MIASELFGRLQEIARLDLNDVTGWGHVRVGSVAAQRILDNEATLAAVRQVVFGPRPSIQALRVLLSETTSETINITARTHATD